jgi:hypothetical protein
MGFLDHSRVTIACYSAIALLAIHSTVVNVMDTLNTAGSYYMPEYFDPHSFRVPHKPLMQKKSQHQVMQTKSCSTHISTFNEVWGDYYNEDHSNLAAVFTPYHITPGGGEKYLLSIVQAMQYAGYIVVVYVYPGNACRCSIHHSHSACMNETQCPLLPAFRPPNTGLTYHSHNFPCNEVEIFPLNTPFRTCCRDKNMLMETAIALRVNLNPDMLRHEIWRKDVPRPKIFFSLGNEKAPQTPNIGTLGFYMCQFPFDLERPMSEAEYSKLGTYDYVFLNSRFSFKW